MVSMQTFLPYYSYVDSARVLDYRRLGKQRVEALQILNILEGKTSKPGWRNHPAVKMWQGYESSLLIYMNCMIEEWVRRGYMNTMTIRQHPIVESVPHWFGDEEFHASHRSNLLRKNPAYYAQFGWSESPDMPYVWPK